jgi:hypothetical protein
VLSFATKSSILERKGKRRVKEEKNAKVHRLILKLKLYESKATSEMEKGLM